VALAAGFYIFVTIEYHNGGDGREESGGRGVM